MNLSEFIDPEFIIADLSASTKPEVLAELVAPVVSRHSQLNSEKLLAILLDRESLGSTGIGDGIAIPHGKLEDIDSVILVAGRSSKGVDFSCLDHKPAHIFFLVLAPESVAGMHLRILASVSRMLQNPVFRDAFLTADTKQELFSLLTTS